MNPSANINKLEFVEGLELNIYKYLWVSVEVRQEFRWFSWNAAWYKGDWGMPGIFWENKFSVVTCGFCETKYITWRIKDFLVNFFLSKQVLFMSRKFEVSESRPTQKHEENSAPSRANLALYFSCKTSPIQIWYTWIMVDRKRSHRNVITEE